MTFFILKRRGMERGVLVNMDHVQMIRRADDGFGCILVFEDDTVPVEESLEEINQMLIADEQERRQR